jgi:hypothetical protein
MASTINNETSPYMEGNLSYPFKCGLGHYCIEYTVILNPQMSLIDVCYIRATEFATVSKYLSDPRRRELALAQQARHFANVYTSFETFNNGSEHRKSGK